jgi:protease II
LKKESYLSTLNFDGTKETKLFDLGLSDLRLFAAATDTVIFYQRPARRYPLEAIFNYNLRAKQLKLISLPLKEKYRTGFYGLDLLPSKDSRSALLSLTDEKGANLESFIYRLETNELINLPVKTLVQKCVWAENNESVYCAYSKELTGAGDLPFSYWQGKVKPNDSFAKFNFKTGEFRVYAEDTVFDAVNLAISSEEDYLVFVNRADGSLYRMKL